MKRTIPSFEVATWVAQASCDYDLSDTKSMPYLVRTWDSRTATLHHFTWIPPSSRDVVVKVHHESQDAEAFFHGLRQVTRVIDGLVTTKDFAPVTPLAMSRDLGAVLMPHISGNHLSGVLIGSGWTSEDFRAAVLRYMYSCGLILAQYHKKHSVSTEGTKREAWTHISTRIERASGCRLTGLDKLNIKDSLVSKSYGDFHVGHIMVTDADEIALIDPPLETQYRYAHRDIALFKYSIFMTLLSPARSWTIPLRIRHYPSLAKAFTTGYANGTQHSLDQTDGLAISGYEAFYLERMLRRALRKRSYVRHAYYATAVKTRLKKLRETLLLQLA